MTPQTFAVDRNEANFTLAAVLKRRLGLSWSKARQLVEARRVRVNGQPAADAAARLRPGQRVSVEAPPEPPRRPAKPRGPGQTRNQTRGADAPRSPRSPRTNHPTIQPPTPPINLVHVDDHVVVVDKPTGLTTMRHADEAAEFGERGRRFLPSTLADLLPRLLPGRPGPVRAVHRLDRDTSGLVVFARTPEAEAHLGRQFRAHTIERLYRAVVRGRATSGRVESVFVDDRGDGRRGSGTGPGKRAVTHVRVAEELGPFTLVECRLETGRTHQVRIHLGERGTPICGERIYDRPPHGPPAADDSGSPRLALHAAVLGFDHPHTGERVRWEAPLPDDLRALVDRLRASLQ